ncbi:MAG: phosphoribosylanthranilate isomerase [Phycisphaerae bacterium]|nr:phosphoribosylanthranilate isomerase [Phycisphaerae bacterium]
MNSVHVKICGLTDPTQARAVADMGADAVGMVFAPSKRRITPEQGAAIVQAVGETARTVGLFVDASAEEINAVIEQTSVSRVQLHGDESPDIIAEIAVPCWKVFHVGDENFAVEIHDWLVCLPDGVEVEAILLDTYSPRAAGGTGESFNWNLVAHLRDEGLLGDLPPIVLAGGLTPGNVAEAIRVVQPSMVDVSSGVESSPGVKDLLKVREFLRAAKIAEKP